MSPSGCSEQLRAVKPLLSMTEMTEELTMAEMSFVLDNELLIHFIQARPVLWDKTLEFISHYLEPIN